MALLFPSTPYSKKLFWIFFGLFFVFTLYKRGTVRYSIHDYLIDFGKTFQY